jgi:hypothetical protein
MIQHIVLFKLVASTEQIEKAGRALIAMRSGIAEIRAVHFGPNLGPSANEYSHVLMVTCDDMDAVSRYLAHPVHRQTVDQFIAPIRQSRLAADIETN